MVIVSLRSLSSLFLVSSLLSILMVGACSSTKTVSKDAGRDGTTDGSEEHGSDASTGDVASDSSDVDADASTVDGGADAGGDGGVTVIPCGDGGAAIMVATTTAPARPVGLTIDDAHVYFTTQAGGDTTPGVASAVMSAPLAGGAPVLLASGETAPKFGEAQGIVVAGGNLYFVAAALWTVPTAGGTPVRLDDSRQSLLTAGGVVYFADYGFTATLKSLTPPSTTPTLLSAAFHGYDLAFNGTTFFWQDGRDGMPDNITKMPVGGAPSILLNNAGNRGNFSSMVADATTVFWGAILPDQLGGVKTVAVAGGEPTVLVSHLDHFVEAMAMDDANLYILTAKFLWKQAKAGGPLVCLSPANIYIPGASLAVDATSVYWPDQGTLRIMKVAK
jgi:hypothetical protein